MEELINLSKTNFDNQLVDDYGTWKIHEKTIDACITLPQLNFVETKIHCLNCGSMLFGLGVIILNRNCS